MDTIDGSYYRVALLSVLGELEGALDCFKIAMGQRHPLIFILPHHPIFDEARSHPTTAALIDTMSAPAAQP